MSTIRIGTTERGINGAEPQWINQQINMRRAAGESVCVVVRVNCPGATLTLATPTCSRASGGGGTRAPNDLEQRILELWRERGLDVNEFAGGNVVVTCLPIVGPIQIGSDDPHGLSMVHARA